MNQLTKLSNIHTQLVEKITELLSIVLVYPMIEEYHGDLNKFDECLARVREEYQYLQLNTKHHFEVMQEDEKFYIRCIADRNPDQIPTYRSIHLLANDVDRLEHFIHLLTIENLTEH